VEVGARGTGIEKDAPRAAPRPSDKREARVGKVRGLRRRLVRGGAASRFLFV
jgi:hypothetical protein